MPFSFAHLHVHSVYSDGTAHPLTLCDRAASLGYTTLALTDHNTLDGHAAFVSAGRFHHIRPILGVELRAHLRDLSGHILVLTRSESEYERLRWLIRRKRKVRIADLAGTGYVTTSCLGGIPAQQLADGDYYGAGDTLDAMRDVLGGSLLVEIQPTFGTILPWLMALARERGLPVVATNDVHHLDAPGHLSLNAPAEMARLCVYPGWQQAIEMTGSVAGECAWAA